MKYDFLLAPSQPAAPFSVSDLPSIAKLARIAHHKYKKRWSKRICKRPARLLYDLAYSGLKLGGNARMSLKTESETLYAKFNARRQHFGSLYFDPHSRFYEPDVSALLASLLVGKRHFFDIGANWGFFSFYAVSLPGFHGQIEAFEPAPETRNDLEGLVKDFGLSERICVHPKALSSTSGFAELAIHDQETGLNRLVGSGVGREGTMRTMIEKVRLDDLNIVPDVIKMDVEDHEYEALLGGINLLAKAKPYIVVENWLSPSSPMRTLRALRLLEHENYKLFQPCWVSSQNNSDYISTAFPGGDNPQLVLAAFKADHRFALSEQMNVFACHQERLDELICDGFKPWPVNEARPT